MVCKSGLVRVPHIAKTKYGLQTKVKTLTIAFIFKT